jgi:hypothetical protein
LQITSLRSRLKFLGMIMLALFGLIGQAHSQCGNPANAIVAENCLTGNPASEWDINGTDPNNAGDLTIQGFATDISVNQGGTVYFKISTPATAYTINIYRMGYYGGMGARKVTTVSPSAPLPQVQPPCISDPTTGLIDCGNWGISAHWQVPANATSGIYFAHLVRNDTGGDSHIVFIVRNDSSASAILFQTSDESWQAYNYYGMGSLYGPNQPFFDLSTRSYKVSYNRPFLTRNIEPESNTWVFGAEFPMIQWLESNGYDVTYFTGVDAARYGALIKNHKIFMDSGHDEYWSGPRRASVQAARDAGVNLAFFSGNEMFWKTRWENSVDGTNTPNRTLVCYKETLGFAKLDPADPPTWTGTWRDPTFSPPADGGNPENALTGNLFMINGPGPDNDGSLTMKVPSADGKMRFWRNTALASLPANATYTLPTGSLGYEWDEDIDNGYRPAGLFHLSTSTYTMTSDLLLDYGAIYGAGVATHHLTLYRAPSGALVFGAGTVNWSWSLNSNHDNPFGFANPAPDPNVQQATVNLFADMGVQPATLQSGLVPASASSDQTPPQSTITSPASGSAINAGAAVTVTGTATDVGGAVAGVEFSGDGGATWHPATGRSNWSYTWSPSTVGSITLMSRAVDDTGNLEAPHTGIKINVGPQICPCSIWNSSSVPTYADSGDSNSVEVGVKFRADANGSIIGVRFYKTPLNTGTHIGHVWSSSGALLGTATFTNESSSGWQQINFSAPISVSANTTYIVSYMAPKGHYAGDNIFFAQSGVDSPPLHALASGVDGQNGVFASTSDPSGAFPSGSYLSTNYWVDVVYTSSNIFSISGKTGGYGGAGATVSLSGTETATTVADASGSYNFGGIVNGTYIVSPSNPGVTFTPSSQTVTINGAVATGINFTAVVTNPQSISGNIANGAGATVTLGGSAAGTTVADASGNYSLGGLLNGTFTVTPSHAGYIFSPGTQTVTLTGASAPAVNFQGQICNCYSIWQASATPTLIDSNDGASIEVGVKFRSDTTGYIAGLRFYKASANLGTHVAHIWSGSGNLLGSATFTGETGSGWQQVTFSSPILVYANTSYVASYFAPVGHYSASSNYFGSAGVDSPPLHALANGLDGSNGLYLYTASGGFPASSFNSTNYWVDVVFTPAQSYSVSGAITGIGGSGATVTLSGPLSATTTADGNGNYTFNTVYPGSYSITPSMAGVVFSPGNQNVTVVSSSVTGVNFTVPQICPCNTLWQSSTQPTVADSADAHPYELGVKFRTGTDGYILGVRFYKAATNTGVHIGNLWSNAGSGSLLSTAAFANESVSGWQQVLFANPVPVSANNTYVASYFTPSGHYSADAAFFASVGVDSPPLHALASGVEGQNGIYSQSSTSIFPSSSFNSNNYWVDVIYATTTTHNLGGVISGAGAAGATLVLSGVAAATTTTDASGNYSFSGLADGTYTVTPSKSGFAFSPGSQTTTISGAHNLAVNFISGPPTYVVSGTISGAPGITVSLAGTTIAQATTDASGNYSFPTVPNGTYTVTPSGVGFAVSPVSQNITVSGANVGAVNFTATAIAYSITGTISGGAGATVNLTGAVTATTTADSSGNYSFSGITGGSYSITPTKTGLVFTPTNLAATVAGANILGANFAVPQNCPCDTIWQPSATPSVVNSTDNESIEVGVKFRSDSSGYITGIRFYKSTANGGTHQGNLWSSTGTLLATATFTNEGGSGWQQVFFSNPIAIVANTTYIASYFTPAGNYSADTGFFISAGVDTPPLHALANGTDGLNGVYFYGPSSAFPTNSYNAANYWVDVVYAPAFTISGTISGAGGAGATVSLSGPVTASVIADASGNYTFGVTNGSYVVTPSNTGYIFAPASQNVPVSGSNVTVPTFTATPKTYTITGTISGAGGNGGTVSLSGAATASTTANASGVYTFSGISNGSYTVTPSSGGYVFTPASQAVTVNGANATANFSSAGQTFTISGTVSGAGGNGATVNLSGAATATTTANASGVYTFSGVTNGSYTVTPTKTGFVFTTPSQAVTVNGANGTANFSSAQVFTISGTISGAGGSGATVTLTGAATATVIANTSGVYSFSVVNGSYTVTPTKTGFIFTPPSQAIIVNGGNATANFSSAQTFTISGTISGTGGNGATVKLTGAATATVTANASGAYTFTGVVNGSYTVTPTKTGFIFTPPSQAVTINGANATVNFTSTQVFTISGTISGAAGNGATVKLTGAATATVTANGSGVYTFSNVANGSYTVTPTKPNHIILPTSKATTVNSGNVTGLNFSTLL